MATRSGPNCAIAALIHSVQKKTAGYLGMAERMKDRRIRGSRLCDQLIGDGADAWDTAFVGQARL